jgi:hypothetical protein
MKESLLKVLREGFIIIPTVDQDVFHEEKVDVHGYR